MNNFEHYWNVTVDERIFWDWARDQPWRGNKVARKPRGFGQEYKYLPVVRVQVTTTFEHVISKKVNDERE